MQHFSNEFCKIDFYNQFVILVINENVNFTLDKASVIREKLREHYQTRDFLMISYRKFNHNVSEEVYKQGQLPNMKGLAVVSDKKEERDKALIEQQLYGRSFVFFTCIDEAISWAEGYFN
ncbi:hypothetical protein M0D21_03475 [Aquimarina sp. D1M17]|uniref:hypothetical protein n=1 Tax=Aquimarina acroporae TaxID=2937283 RepID=UPI0020C0B587|nr:hypothetical protein [Aquimarina acroporae]MCK8520612.1 hypothetical protein [Aquimarina acroporae]